MFRNANKSLGAWAGWVKDEDSKKKIEGFSNPIINPTTITTPTPIYIKNAYNNAYLSPDCSGATPVNQNVTDINQATLYTLSKLDTTYTIRDTTGSPYYIGNRFCNTSGESTSSDLDISANTVSGNAAATYSIQKKGVTTNSDYLIADEIGSRGSGVYNIYPSTLKSLMPLQNVTKIACGINHTVVLVANGVLKSWGNNEKGQLGDGTNDRRNTPGNVVEILKDPNTQIACGANHTVAVINGVLKSWGDNGYGQLGNGTNDSRNIPGDVSGSLINIGQIACGFGHTVVVADGGLKSWGLNDKGQLGDGGTTTQRNIPYNISGISTNANTQIACGGQHTVALVNNVLKSWGDNDHGQLGNGTTAKRNTPGDVSGSLTNITQIACGFYHTVVVANGVLKSWGLNDKGQLGNGKNDRRNTPGDVYGGLTDITQIACGFYHTVVVADGVLKSWGFNYNGQLGIGANESTNTPGNVAFLSLKTIGQIACGRYHTVAVADGELKSWGNNEFGQLGDGRNNDRDTPVNVVGSLESYPTPREKSRWIFEGLPRLPKQDPTLTSEGTFLNAVKGTFTTVYPVNRQLYISINNNGTIASFSYTTPTTSERTFILDFTSGTSGSASFKMGTDAAISLTGNTLESNAQLNGAVPASNTTAFSINQFVNASFTISFYDPIDTTTPLIGEATWTQTVTNLPSDNYVAFMVNSEQVNKYLGVTPTTSTKRPIILRPVLNAGVYTINGLNYPNSTGNTWRLYDKYINNTNVITPIPQVVGQGDDYSRILIKDNSNVLRQLTDGNLEFVANQPPNNTINSPLYKVVLRKYKNQKLGLALSVDSLFTECYIELTANTTYAAYPQSIQIKIDILNGASQTATFRTDIDTSVITLRYGTAPVILIGGTQKTILTTAISPTDTFTVTIYIVDTANQAIIIGQDDYFARGTLTGIAAPVKANGTIVRAERDNGTRITFQLPDGKKLLPDTKFNFYAASSSGSVSRILELDSNVTNATSFTLDFYNTIKVAAFNINDKSYEIDTASTTLNYYSSITLYAYRKPFASTSTTDYDYLFTTAATPEPALTGSLAITASTASTTTLTGQTSASLPGRPNKFPRYMKLYLKAKNAATVGAAIIYNCKTDAGSFTISTLSPTSTDTTTQATIQFEGNDPVSLGAVLTSADIFELFIDDAISPIMSLTPILNKQYDEYFQKYTYAPPSLIMFGVRSNVSITGSVRQSINQTTSGYRAIPSSRATFEFAIKGTGSATTQTTAATTLVSLNVDVADFTLSFSVGTAAAKLTVAGVSEPIILTGVTVYNYQTFTLTIKDSTGTEFARGVASSICSWDDCKAAIETARSTYTVFDAATSTVCDGCFLTEKYDPCTASGDCENEQYRLTKIPTKWSGSEILACQACGSMKDSKYDPCRSASCGAAKSQAASAYQPYSASDLSDCAYCPTGTGGADSYNPCTASGDCENEQSRLTKSFIKWSGSDIKQCKTCGEDLKGKENDPCKSTLCAAAKARAASAYLPYSASDLSDCAYCPTGTGGADSYNPCTASGDCESEQSRLTAIPTKWSGSEILACQACGSMKDNKYDPCRSASCGAAKSQAASAYLAYSASNFSECDYCPPGTGGVDTYDPCSDSGDCATVQAALTASMRPWEGKDIPQCQQCGSLKQGSFYPCFSKQCAAAQKRMTASYIPWNSVDIPECDNCTASELVGSYDPCSANGGPCERRQTELTALGISWNAAELNECKYCAELAGSWAPTASASMPTASASITASVAPTPAVGGGIFTVFQGAVAPTPIAAAPRPPMPLKPIKPVPTYTPVVKERTVTVTVNEKNNGAAKTPAKRDYCIDEPKGFLANLVCEIRGDIIRVGGKVKQVLGIF
jgi:alpha-tubulin suppressor-like RCC1 family protein